MKKIFVAAAVLFLIGVTIIVVGYAASGFDIMRLEADNEYTDCDYAAQNAVSKIVIDDKNAEIFIVSAGVLRVEYQENDKEKYEVTEKDGILTLKKIDNRKWHDKIFVLNFETPKVTLFVTENYDGMIEVETDNGKVSADGVSAGEMKLKTSNEKIQIQGVSLFGGLEIRTSNGEISIIDSVIGGNAVGKTNNGKSTLKNVTAKNIEVNTSNGIISVENTVCEILVLETNNGTITLSKAAAAVKIDCKTSNGKISGTILGDEKDFSITSKTSNGKNNLTNSSGNPKTANFRNSNGSIEIYFE